MRPVYIIFVIMMLFYYKVDITDWLEIVGLLNYLTLVLIGYGIFLLRHLMRVFLYREDRLLSVRFVGKSIWILGLTLGLPFYLEHMKN